MMNKESGSLMVSKWTHILYVLVTVVIQAHGDQEMYGDIGETPPDPVKEMLRRFDASPWTVFAIETTTSRIEREIKEYLAQHEYMEDIEKEMKIHGIVPDFLEECPRFVLNLRYKEQESNFSTLLHLAEIYTPTLTMNKPFKVEYDTKPNTSYIHMLIDPDHKVSRFEPEMDSSDEDLIPTTTDDGIPKTFVHYLKVNVPHYNSTHGGDEIIQYLAPHPPNGTGLHRYVYLVYEQPKHYINFTEKFIPDTTAYERDWFKLHHFARKYNLQRPLAGTFFYARFDESVPYIYAHLDDVFI